MKYLEKLLTLKSKVAEEIKPHLVPPAGKAENALENTKHREDLFEELVGESSGYLLEYFPDFSRFFKTWVENRSPETILQKMHARETWNALRSDESSKSFLEQKIKTLLQEKGGYKAYQSIHVYKSMGYKDVSQFLGEILNHEYVWNDNDSSKWNTILEFLSGAGDPNSISAIVSAIEVVVVAKKGTISLSKKLPDAVNALKVLAGDKTPEILENLAAKNKTFGGWLEVGKLKLLSEEAYNYYAGKTYRPDVYDAQKEAGYAQKMQEACEAALKNPRPAKLSHESLRGDDLFDDGSLDNYDWHNESPDTEEDNPTSEQQESAFDSKKSRGEYWQRSTAVNFYGRFGTEKEVAGYLEITAENYPTVLRALVQRREELSEKDYFHFLRNKIKPELLSEMTTPTLGAENLSSVFFLGSAHAWYRAAIEGSWEEALAELEILNETVAGHVSSEGGSENPIIPILLEQLDGVRKNVVKEQARQKTLPISPKSMEEFLIYHSKLQKSRLIPSYQTLLMEKVCRCLALELFHTSGKPEGLSPRNTSSIIGQYWVNMDLYTRVEAEDAPLYWEGKDKLEDFDADRCVVFGRDGRYFFTALKTHDFGVGEKELKYLVITRNMQGGATSKDITNYLTQHGVTLDFTFIDTGYSGSIPKFAIDLLSKEQGVTLDAEKIDEKIKLLSSVGNPRRKEISRQRPGDDAQNTRVHGIELRPQKIDSPHYLELKNGKLEPVEKPTSVSEQLQAWTVEHVSLRNFAPRLDGEKRIKYIQKNPLEGWEYVEDLRSAGAVATHPIELWKNAANDSMALLKGGPEHTLRAEFVGSQFFKKLGLNAPKGDLVQTESGLRFKMDYLENYTGGAIHLPEQYHNAPAIQRGLLADMLVAQYDRTPWNLMFEKNSANVAFIDHGGCLTSRARGGYKGFADHFTVEEMTELLKSPQFAGEPVNEAYANFVEVRDGRIVIKNPQLMRSVLASFQENITTSVIEEIVEQAKYPDGRRSVDAMKKKVQELEQMIGASHTSQSDRKKSLDAIETYKKAIEAGGEATYLKKALQQRSFDIKNLISSALQGG